MQVEPAISKAQQRPIGHRYQVLGLRGSGAEASVHLAIDLFTGQEVALKLGPPERLAPEYRRSAALAHPHLARAVSLWHEAGGASLALEYGAEDLTAVRGCAEAVVVGHVAGIARAVPAAPCQPRSAGSGGQAPRARTALAVPARGRGHRGARGCHRVAAGERRRGPRARSNRNGPAPWQGGRARPDRDGGPTGDRWERRPADHRRPVRLGPFPAAAGGGDRSRARRAARAAPHRGPGPPYPRPLPRPPPPRSP